MNLKVKNGFTIIEVSILFVIFLIVAFLVAPLSLDDTIHARNISRWKNVQESFDNIYYSINTQKDSKTFDFKTEFNTAIKSQEKGDMESYKIRYLNGRSPMEPYNIKNLSQTYSNASVGYNLFSEPKNGYLGIILYDVNGSAAPNVWGKDVFGFNITENGFEPLCKKESIPNQKKDCSRGGTGLCCSNYYLIGGSLR